MLNQTWTSTIANNFDYASSTPNSDTSILASHRFNSGVVASAAYYRQNGMTWIGTVGNGRVPQYDRFDARVAKTFKVDGHRVEWGVVGQNLLGSYVEQTPALLFQRRYFTTLQLTL